MCFCMVSTGTHDCVLLYLLQYLVSVPLKMFRLWAFLGMMSQVRLVDGILLNKSQADVFSSCVPLHLSDSVGLFCGPVLEGKLRQRCRLDVSDHWSACGYPDVRPRLLRPEFWRRVTERHSVMEELRC